VKCGRAEEVWPHLGARSRDVGPDRALAFVPRRPCVRRQPRNPPTAMHAFRSLVLSVVLAASVSHGFADILLYANLTNGQEPGFISPTTTLGQPRPASFGSATFILNDAMTSLTFAATINNIDVTGSQTPDTNDNLSAAHIHAGANVAPGSTVTGGVVWGFFGAPFNDNNPADSVVTPFSTGVGGTFTGKWDTPEGNNTTLTAQLDNILNGRTYINFHTTQFGGGEIRGAIVRAPDGGVTALLFGFAALSLVGLRRKFSPVRRK
jgi:hypothetical protein